GTAAAPRRRSLDRLVAAGTPAGRDHEARRRGRWRSGSQATAAVRGWLGRDDARLLTERRATRRLTFAVSQGAPALPPGDLAGRSAKRPQARALPPAEAGARAGAPLRLLPRRALAARLAGPPVLRLADCRRAASDGDPA